MKNYRIAVITPGNAQLEECELQEPKADEVLIRNCYTVVSAGTERAWSMDMQNAHATFPYYPGYCGSGEVVKVGDAVTRVKVGDRVVVNWAGHSLYSIKNECRVYAPGVENYNPEALYALHHTGLVVIPENVDSLDASLASIAAFSINGVRKLQLEIGESAMVAGQGLRLNSGNSLYPYCDDHKTLQNI